MDLRDGFIHLSSADQVLETARLHFAGRDDLVAVEFDAGDLGSELRWESSRGGELFPHLYSLLPAGKARAVRRLLRGEDGSFAFGSAAGCSSQERSTKG